MKIYKHSSNSDEENGQFKHTPEFIYIDDQKERRGRIQILKGQEEEYVESIQRFEKTRYPFVLRCLTFLGSIASFVLASTLLIAAFVIFLISMLLLFQSQYFNQILIKYWGMFRKTIVFSLGALIATLSPAFGVGIIALYFLLQGEDMDSNYFSRLIKTKLYK